MSLFHSRVLAFLSMAALTIACSLAVHAVPLYPGEPNAFSGIAMAENAGYRGAPVGTQAATFTFPGAEVSLDTSGASGSPLVVNLPQPSAALGAALGAGGPQGLRVPCAYIIETTQVKDGTSIAFGQEMTAVIGGLFPTRIVPAAHGGVLDNGMAPGSTAGDGVPDQLLPLPVPTLPVAIYVVTYGPGSVGKSEFLSMYPAPPVFAIYEDVPPVHDFEAGSASNLEEMHFDFDGAAGSGGIGPSVPPPTASPDQFVNTADEALASTPNQVRYATDGTLFAAGFIESASAVVTFFDPATAGSRRGPNGGYVYKVEFTAKGRVVEGSVLATNALLPPDPNDLSVWDGKPVNITFACTLYGEAFATRGNAASGFQAGDGEDNLKDWAIRTSVAGNSGDASFTITPTARPLVDLELAKACRVETAPDGGICPRTPGYWKNHPGAWPVETLVVGGVEYTKGELLNLLDTLTPEGERAAWDPSVKLAKFVVATKLSLLAGAEPGDIADTVALADTFLQSWPPGSCPSGDAAETAEELKDRLDTYLNSTPPCGGSGCSIERTLTLVNRGPGDATGVAVTDVLPVGLTLISASASRGDYEASTGRWTVGSLEAGASATLILVTSVSAPGDYTNVAEVAAADQEDVDSTPDNHVASEDDQATCTATCASQDDHECDPAPCPGNGHDPCGKGKGNAGGDCRNHGSNAPPPAPVGGGNSSGSRNNGCGTGNGNSSGAASTDKGGNQKGGKRP